MSGTRRLWKRFRFGLVDLNLGKYGLSISLVLPLLRLTLPVVVWAVEREDRRARLTLTTGRLGFFQTWMLGRPGRPTMRKGMTGQEVIAALGA